MKSFIPTASIVFLFLHIISLVTAITGPFFPRTVEITITAMGAICLFGFSLLHALTSWGTTRACTFIVLTLVISFAFEAVGVQTGWPFGNYHYTERLGPLVLGLVPPLVPIMWFTMLYPAHAVALRIASAKDTSVMTSFQIASVGAMAMTAWDLLADPLLVDGQHWVWDENGAYFGIPVSNYGGWLLTSFLILMAYELISKRMAPHPDNQLNYIWHTLPVLSYSGIWLLTSALMFTRGMPAVGLTGFIGMGGFAIAALARYSGNMFTLELARNSYPRYSGLRILDHQVSLTKQNLQPDPFEQFSNWVTDVAEVLILEPNTMMLATASKDGTPSARKMVLTHWDHRGFIFLTNYQSQKGLQLAENPRAALLFYWEGYDRQVRINGQVEKLTSDESDNYFLRRSRHAQLVTLASAQSTVVSGRSALEDRHAAFARRHAGNDLTRSPQWGGYRLMPHVFEFWQGHPSDLHDRLRYSRQSDGTWLLERLAP